MFIGDKGEGLVVVYPRVTTCDRSLLLHVSCKISYLLVFTNSPVLNFSISMKSYFTRVHICDC